MFERIAEIWRLSKRAFGRYRWQIAVLVVLGFVSGLLEGIGVNALIPLLSFATGFTGEEDFVTAILRQSFANAGVAFSVTNLLIFIVILFILKAAALLAFTQIKVRITSDYEYVMRGEVFSRMQRANWNFLMKEKMGHMETMLTTSMRQMSTLLEQVSEFIIVFSGLIVYAVIAFNISPSITLYTLALGALIFIVFYPMTRMTRLKGFEMLKVMKESAHYISENLLGMKTIKAYSVKNDINEGALGIFKRLRDVRISVYWLRGVTNALIQPISLIFITIVFAFSYATSEFSFAAFVAVVYLVQRIFSYFQQMQGQIHRASEAVAFLKGVVKYEEEAILNSEKRGGEDFVFARELSFNDVGFSYGERVALKGVSVTIKKGETLGIVGKSGSGKTTFVDLLLRLFDPSSGTIMVDGVPSSSIDIEMWRRKVAYVPQDLFLMSGTVRDNIRFYDENISDALIEEAAKKAEVMEFATGLKNGLDTFIGERGLSLSAGQRQRVVIARALARRPEVLVLDEATSALDPESEEKVQRVIRDLMGEMTIVMIAHRLNTVMNADRVLVFSRGEVVESGSPGELLKNPESRFSKAWQAA